MPPGTLWPADERLHLFRVGQEIVPRLTDACDPRPTVRIANVTGGDVRFDEGAVCVRAARSGSSNPVRTYTVTLEAVDASGNTSRRTVAIANTDLAPAVADDDPRCP